MSKSPGPRILLTVFWMTLLTACSGGGGSTSQPGTSSGITFDSPVAGVTPYISFVTAHGTSLAKATEIDYTITAKPGFVSKPLTVRYSIDYLVRRGYTQVSSQAVTIPVFGLYAGYTNSVSVTVAFSDNSSVALPLKIATAVPSGVAKSIYSKPTIKKARAPGSSLGFDYFYMESLLGTPVIVDTDGEVRWVGPGTMESPSSRFIDNGFVVGSPDAPEIHRFELDGITSVTPLISTDPAIKFTTFHHNINPGKTGLFVDMNGYYNGHFMMESLLAEIDYPSGRTISTWNFNEIVANYMRSQGDDPGGFVFYGDGWIVPPDWFHMNSAIYDPSDDSIIVSSRENFVIKVDYQTGNIIWIFGDPTKYWYTFPSLRAKSIVLIGPGDYPIGQHALSFTPDGLLLMFNNGLASLYQPAGKPVGASLPYSVIAAYSIDGNSRTARQIWEYDQGHAPPPDLCSSAYQTSDGSTLIDYAVWPAAIKTVTFAVLVGLDSTRQPVFEFQYLNPSFCTTAWAAQPLPSEVLIFR